MPKERLVESGFEVRELKGFRTKRSLSNGQASRLATLRWQTLLMEAGGLYAFVARWCSSCICATQSLEPQLPPIRTHYLVGEIVPQMGRVKFSLP